MFQQFKRIIQSRIFLHLLFWILSFYILLQHFSISSQIGMVDYIFTTVFHLSLVTGVYLNLYFLIPGYLDKSNYWKYIIGLVLLFILVYLVHIFTYEYLVDIIFPGYYLIAFYDWIEMIKYFIIYVGITTIFVLSKSWFDLIDSRKRLAELEKENLKNELQALKSQINPHFLFNSLNSVYSLALKKSNDTPEVILKLSDVLRYVIYESNEPLVELRNEIKFLRNYIDLQKLRYKYSNNITLTVEGNMEDIKIAPLIFIVFMENAIKHGLVGIDKDDFVDISILAKENEIIMVARNSNYPEDINVDKDVGIGLENVKRRLDLAYPGNHYLIVDNHENVYKVELNIQLE